MARVRTQFKGAEPILRGDDLVYNQHLQDEVFYVPDPHIDVCVACDSRRAPGTRRTRAATIGRPICARPQSVAGNVAWPF
ncbi:MAG: hypothetical protein NVS3B17_20040 [Vulcanimicrobiaceae bacterium]